MSAYQPRWLAYCRAHGLDPDDAGPAWRFINWIRGKWSEWDVLTKHSGIHTEADHAAFDAWLSESVEQAS